MEHRWRLDDGGLAQAGHQTSRPRYDKLFRIHEEGRQARGRAVRRANGRHSQIQTKNKIRRGGLEKGFLGLNFSASGEIETEVATTMPRT